jgi:hypothetical protein
MSIILITKRCNKKVKNDLHIFQCLPPPSSKLVLSGIQTLASIHLDWYNQEHNQSIADPVKEENQP